MVASRLVSRLWADHAIGRSSGAEMRAALDQICEAVEIYMHRHVPDAVRILPNRVAALACVDVVRAWSVLELSKD